MNEEKIEHFYDKAKGEDCGPAPKMECPQCRGHYSSSMITVRDTFAMSALSKLVIPGGWFIEHPDYKKEIQRVAQNAYDIADAMLEERYKRREEKLTVPHPDYD